MVLRLPVGSSRLNIFIVNITRGKVLPWCHGSDRCINVRLGSRIYVELCCVKKAPRQENSEVLSVIVHEIRNIFMTRFLKQLNLLVY